MVTRSKHSSASGSISPTRPRTLDRKLVSVQSESRSPATRYQFDLALLQNIGDPCSCTLRRNSRHPTRDQVFESPLRDDGRARRAARVKWHQYPECLKRSYSARPESEFPSNFPTVLQQQTPQFVFRDTLLDGRNSHFLANAPKLAANWSLVVFTRLMTATAAMLQSGTTVQRKSVASQEGFVYDAAMSANVRIFQRRSSLQERFPSQKTPSTNIVTLLA
jgi:hypothetical protein